MNYNAMIDLLNQMNLDDLEDGQDISFCSTRCLIIRGLGKLRDNESNFGTEELKLTNEFIEEYNSL